MHHQFSYRLKQMKLKKTHTQYAGQTYIDGWLVVFLQIHTIFKEWARLDPTWRKNITHI